MASQSYGTDPGRMGVNAVGTSPPLSVSTRPTPIVLSNMKQADVKRLAAIKKR